MWRRVDENCSVLDRLSLVEFTEKQHGSFGRACSKRPDVEQFVRLRIDGVQPAALVIDSNHRLVDRDLIRDGVAVGLQVGLLHPVVDGRSTPFGAQPLKIQFRVESDNSARENWIPTSMIDSDVRSRSTNAKPIHSLPPLRRSDSDVDTQETKASFLD